MGFKKHCCRCTVYTLLVLGVPLLIAGIIVAALGSFKSLAEDEIKKNLPLKSGSTSFENWEKSEADMFIEYYVFNITNTNSESIPEIEQLGPYTYREDSVKNVVKRQGQTITYIPNTKYYFDQARSCQNCNPLTDKIVAINYPLLVILGFFQPQFKNLPPEAAADFVKKMKTIYNISLYQTRSIHELLWGYNDPALSKFILANLGQKSDRVYALQFNNSGSGLSKIHTGEHDVDRVAEYLKWNGVTKLPWWNSDTANAINGTDGTRFKPSLAKEDELYVLVTEICRSVKFKYDSTVKVHDIELYRYTIPTEILESGDVNPNNKGFCISGPDKKCLPSGLVDISVCKGSPGSPAPPLIASASYFEQGDPRLSKLFNLKPEKEIHRTYFDVEPNTGLTMQGHKRLQLNVAIPNLSLINLLRDVNTSTPVIFPLFFTDESAIITEDDADDFKKKVLVPLRAIGALSYVMIALGALFLLIAFTFLLCKIKKSTAIKDKDVVLENYPGH